MAFVYVPPEKSTSKPVIVPVVVCTAASEIDAMVLFAVPAMMPVEFMSRACAPVVVKFSLMISFPVIVSLVAFINLESYAEPVE